MSITISQAKDELAGMLHGTSLSKVQNLNGVFNRAARDFLLDLDPETTRRKQQITNALYDEVYDYPVPSDLKGDAVINISTTSLDTEADEFRQVHEKKFNLDKEDSTFDVLMNSGVKYVQISKTLNSSVVLNTSDSLTSNGTWSVSGDFSGLTLDEINYVTGTGSLKFNSSGVAGAGVIQNTTMTASDLTDYEGISSLFTWVYLPTASLVTSMKLDWGNDVTTAYFSDTVATPHFGTFVDGWNLVRFDWEGATETGTVDVTTIDSVKLTVNYTSGTAMTNLRLDNILVQNGRMYDMSYYSNCLFKDSSTLAWVEETDNDNDIINLDGTCFNIYLYKVAQHAASQNADNKDDAVYYATMYTSALANYKKQFSSDKAKKTQSYYNM